MTADDFLFFGGDFYGGCFSLGFLRSEGDGVEKERRLREI